MRVYRHEGLQADEGQWDGSTGSGMRGSGMRVYRQWDEGLQAVGWGLSIGGARGQDSFMNAPCTYCTLIADPLTYIISYRCCIPWLGSL